MYVQEYLVKLLNGDEIIISEPYELEGEKSLLGWFERAKPDDLCSSETFLADVYFPKRSILSITATQVKKVDASMAKEFERIGKL